MAFNRFSDSDTPTLKVCVCVRNVGLLEDGDEKREPGDKRT